MVSMASCLFSGVPPLGKYMESTTSPKVPIKGAVWKPISREKASVKY